MELTTTTFADRLRELIGEQPVSAFARKVDLSEGLIRKYLAGSEPGLSRANQIARATNTSLEWLATGAGFRFGRAELVDMGALERAIGITLSLGSSEPSIANEKSMKMVVALYQYLRATRQGEASYDSDGARSLADYIAGMCGMQA